MFFFFGVLRRVGPKQVSPVIFGFKKPFQEKKSHHVSRTTKRSL